MAGHRETYRGREIVVEDDDQEAREVAPEVHDHDDPAGGPKLLIDGKEIEVHVNEDGSVGSHDYMFQVFGSRAELARALIDQMPAV